MRLSNIKYLLLNISNIMSFPRQKGRTIALEKCAKEIGAQVIYHNKEFAKKRRSDFSIYNFLNTRNILGNDSLFLIDHYAIREICLHAISRIIELEDENKKLKEQLNITTTTNTNNQKVISGTDRCSKNRRNRDQLF